MKQKKTIYIFGNPLLDFDNFPIKLAPKLEKLFPNIKFIITDPNENLEPVEKELILIDTIKGIEKVVVIDDIEKIETQKLYSPHDFDLGFNLKLLQKIGKLEKTKIIGVPMNENEIEIFEQLTQTIKNEI